jgi:UDP-4-amino-4,6-dideoxy-N-acetyl-beta-L-altrosamine N-acetyltransferase
VLIPDVTGGALRPMQSSDLDIVLGWRNRPEIRRFMFSSDVISASDHTDWFAHASVDPDRWLLIYERDGDALGYSSLSRIRSSNVAEWGYYVSPDAPRGTGTSMASLLLSHAFGDLDLHKVYAETLGGNERGAAFNLRLGFSQEGELREHHFDGGTYRNVLCFGLLCSDWKSGLATKEKEERA